MSVLKWACIPFPWSPAGKSRACRQCGSSGKRLPAEAPCLMCDDQARQSRELAVPWSPSGRERSPAKPLAGTSPPKALPIIEIKMVHLQEWRGQQGVPLLAQTILCKKIWSCLLPLAGRLIRTAFFWEYRQHETWLYYAWSYVTSKPSIEVVEWVEARGKLSVCSLQINDLVAWFGCEFVPSKK